MAVRRLIPTPANYRDSRYLEYPTLGDMVDALVKKEGGDSTEWDALVVKRAAVKTKWPTDGSGPV
jgi:hypothetical protein